MAKAYSVRYSLTNSIGVQVKGRRGSSPLFPDSYLKLLLTVYQVCTPKSISYLLNVSVTVFYPFSQPFKEHVFYMVLEKHDQ